MLPVGLSFPLIPALPHNLPIRTDSAAEQLSTLVKLPIPYHLLTSVPFYYFTQLPIDFVTPDLTAIFTESIKKIEICGFEQALISAQQGNDYLSDPALSDAPQDVKLAIKLYFLCLRAICNCALQRQESIDDLSVLYFGAPDPMKIWAATLRDRIFLRTDPPDVDSVLHNSKSSLELGPDSVWQSEIAINLAIAFAFVNKTEEGNDFYKHIAQLSPHHAILPALNSIYAQNISSNEVA